MSLRYRYNFFSLAFDYAAKLYFLYSLLSYSVVDITGKTLIATADRAIERALSADVLGNLAQNFVSVTLVNNLTLSETQSEGE